MTRKNFNLSDFYCTKCGKKGIPIARKKGQDRELGHLKVLYCVHCQEETNHVEIRKNYTYYDFYEEFSLGRFVNGNRIPVAQLESCSTRNDCKYNKSGKCWNATKNHICEKRSGGC